MKRLVIINNYMDKMPQKRKESFDSAFSPLQDLDVQYVFYENLMDLEIYNQCINADGIILSGSELNLSELETVRKMKNVIQLIREFKNPILGICFGIQLIGNCFGYKIDYLEDKNEEWQKSITLDLLIPFELIDGMEITVDVTHQQKIKYIPDFEEEFRIYASSPACRIQIIKSLKFPIYGVQFHPESKMSNIIQKNGKEILCNFISML